MKFNKTFIGVLSLFASLSLNAQEKHSDKPKLVVGIVVDQMRWDYLYRYQDRYTKDGFNRLLSEGFSNENTYIPYVPTYTAIGHSTIYTGSVPAIHGIAGNDFIIQATGQEMYCTQDDEVNGVGTTSKAGKMSPKNLLTTTVTDQLKLATNFRSKVYGVSLKDRGGILPAGHFADAAFWFDGETGNWISSTFYMNELPQWLQKFNDKKLTDKYLDKWTTLYPIDTYKQSEKDGNPYRANYKGNDKMIFPYDLKAMKKDNGFGLIRSTPFGNTLTKDIALAIIENEKLGKNDAGITDFLAISFSSTDYVGHQFSPNTIEAEDTYLRLDKDLGDIFNYLDKNIGKGEYLVFLSADHGGAHNPKYIQDKKGNAGYFQTSTVKKELNAKLESKFKAKDIVRSLSNYQVHLNYDVINSNDLDEDNIREEIVKYMQKVDGVSFAADMDNIANSPIPAIIKERMINGYNRKRSGAINYILDPQWYGGKVNAGGTTHGTWGSYDSHIPFVLMGWGIKPGKNYNPVHMTDIAPTISALLKIEEPNGNIGKPVVEVLQ
ncbi:alkaline phosphatase PafA [Faecalibacter macacae]|uniref:Alkaline phosphatase family protein n=1 Tax=Faecalibacter macacae TaxID=1859289 RepID=A0A3L9M993_9FLAO|nr:alkaline phosphatase PafA [Faecalibacter macacae]RLZ09103.1 alkaline phosphatase family protein [Faecalibacter macacae]